MEKIKQSIFKIITASGTGTGFKVYDQDYLITNYHVVKGSKEVAVEDHNKNRYFAKVIMVNPSVDLAFLAVEELKSTKGTIKIIKDNEVKSRQKIYINGFPFGMPYTITEGIVSSSSQPMGGRNYVQTDAAVNPGNSGGPMLNEQGVLIGVTTSKFSEADNVGFGIKHTDVIKEITDYNFQDTAYRLKCNSCDSFIIEETEFCPSCGNSVDVSVFEEFEKSNFATFTEEAIKELGVDPVLCRAGRDYWEFHQGSALVRIFTVSNNNYLFAASPLNSLPKNNLEELLTYITSNNTPPYQLGIYDNKIYISYRTHLSDIYSDRKEEIKKAIINLALKADELDDFFKDTYGCEMSIESKTEANLVKDVTEAIDDKEEITEVKTTSKSPMEKLKKLKELFEMELITEEEFATKKKAILDCL